MTKKGSSRNQDYEGSLGFGFDDDFEFYLHDDDRDDDGELLELDFDRGLDGIS